MKNDKSNIEIIHPVVIADTYKFFFAIGYRNGDIVFFPFANGHRDIVEALNLDETTKLQNWIPVYYHPWSNECLLDLSKYELKFSGRFLHNYPEAENPFWMTNEIKEKWVRKLNNKVRRMIVEKNTSALSNGLFILRDKVQVEKITNCFIYNAGSAKISCVENTTFWRTGNCNIQNMKNCRIRWAENCRIQQAEKVKIDFIQHCNIQNMKNCVLKN